MSGALDNDRWGLVGAFWVAIDGASGGFLVSPDAIWSGGELARCYRGATARGWDHESIYSYWQRQVGSAGMSLYELTRFLILRGAEQAMNLDGGGSSVMVTQGRALLSS